MSKWGVWTKLEKRGDYTVWRRRMNGVLIYNVTKTGRPPGIRDGGYPNLQALFQLKNIR